MKKTSIILFVITLVFGIIGPVSAEIINGGFETGDFTGWEILGDVSIQTAAFGSGPIEGSYQALLIAGSSAASAEEAIAFSELLYDRDPDFFSGKVSMIKKRFTGGTGLCIDWNSLKDYLVQPSTCDGYFLIGLGEYDYDGSIKNSHVLHSGGNMFSNDENMFPSATRFDFEYGYEGHGFQPWCVEISRTNILEIALFNWDANSCELGLLLDNIRLLPSLDIKANGSDGPITITTTDLLTITASLSPGPHDGGNANWYIVAYTPLSAGWYHYEQSSSSWKPGFALSHRGALINLSPHIVLQRAGLPVGYYTFSFFIGLDTGQLFSDSVNVNVH